MLKDSWKKLLTITMSIAIFAVVASVFPTLSSADITEGLEEGQHATDFSNDEAGAIPSGWSPIWKDSNWEIQDDPRRLNHTLGEDPSRQGLVWDEIGEITGDVEISSLVRASGYNTTLFQIGLHMSGEEESENAYYLDLQITGSGVERVRINRYTNGSYSVLRNANSPFPLEEDTWYNVVLQREGNNLRAKAWLYGTDEPDEFQGEVTHSTLNSGKVGVSGVHAGTINDYAFFGVGVDGAEAPRAPEDLIELEEGDKEALQSRVDTIDSIGLNASTYTTESWGAFNDALTSAKEVLANTNAIQLNIDQALANLNSTFSGLMREGLPATGFEERNGSDWTTLEEELEFIQEIAELSDRVWYEEIGQSVLGRPIHMVYVGAEERTDEEVRNNRTLFIMGTPHGNEPAGRDGALKTLRELAFTEDPDLLEVLEKSTVLIMPTSNPDGREANTRANAWGLDNNRDNLTLVTPENQIIARVLRDYTPDITIDAHERPSGSNPDIEYLWPRNLNVDREIHALNVELIEDYMMPDAQLDGWSTGLYGSPTGAGREDERILRNMGALRHGLGILTESAGQATLIDRVDMQLSSYQSILRFYHERFDEIATVVDGAPARKQTDGANKAPFYLAGADDTPDQEVIMDPPVCGYLLHAKQAKVIERHLDLFGIETEEIGSDGVFITMDQPMMTVVPFLVDDRASYNEVIGLPLVECTDLESVDLPEPPEETPPAQYQTNFSDAQAGPGAPSDWTMEWRDSQWEVKDDPRRLEHYVDSEGGRRVLTWDEAGDVHGDVEVAAVVRPSGSGATLFQLHLHASGDASNETSYYVDVRTSNTIRINRNNNGSFSTRNTATLPFVVDENAWYNILFQREGNDLRAKFWPYGTEEPTEWSVTYSDPIINSGKVGLGHVTSNRYNDWAFVGVGTGGQEAPRAPQDVPGYISTVGLENLVGSIEGENLVEVDYSASTWEALENALEHARNVLQTAEANPNAAVQTDIITATEQLEAARFALRTVDAEQYETDFSEYTVGSAPEDWSILWRDANWKILDNPYRLELSDGSGRRSLTWDTPGEITGDVEVSGVVRTNGSTETMLQMGLHLSGEAGSETGYYLDLRGESGGSTANRVRINSYINGSYSTLRSADLPFTVEEDTWYNVVFQRVGNELRAKLWPFGEEEPEEFQATYTDERLNEGSIGVGHTSSGITNEWAFVGVGTGGEPAPRAPEDVLDFDPEEEQPTTGFEDRNGSDWTTLEEELAFIQEIDALSDRVWYEEIGQSIQGRPIHMVYVGAEERTDEEVRDGRTLFIMGTPHGNEPAGREGALKTLRDLAFTEDEDKLEILGNATVLIMPTSNPDGRAANTRANANGVDNNRDNLNLVQPENQVIARVLRDYTPDITIDAHERPSGSNPDIEYLWPRNLNVDREIYELNVELIEDYMMPDAVEDGWTTGLYGSPTGAGREDERILRNMGGLRHGLTVLTESAGRATNVDRVDMQLSSYQSILRFYQERFDEIAEAVDGAPARKQADGANKADFYLAGADDTPDQEVTIDPPVCGYLLHTDQAEAIDRHIDLFGIETEQIRDDSVFITMDQPMMTVIPFLVDDRANYNEVAGLPLETCTDLETIDPPEPPVDSPPAQYETDFSKDVVGQAPAGWTTQWRDSDWKINDDPRRLTHTVTPGDGRRNLVMDEPGFVRGDVEVSTLVRTSFIEPNTGNSTLFHVHLHASGDASSENSYLLDLRSNGFVRLNQNVAGTFRTLTSERLPFDVEEDVWYNVVLQHHDEMLRGKVWPFGQDEPTDWQIEFSGVTHNSGYVGLGQSTGNTINDHAFFGVGTGGEAAPRAPENIFDQEDPVDKAALQMKVDEANGLNEADYTAESWAPLAEALDTAERILADENTTQEAIDEALEALTAAINGLVEAEEPVVDKSDLQEQVNAANDLNEEDYTEESWAPFAEALEAAESILADDDATQEAVNEALDALTAAIAGLEEKEEPVDKAALQAKVEEANALNEEDYTAESWASLAEALEAAESVLADDDATQEAIEIAYDALTAALEGLVPIEEPAVDKTALQAKVEEANALNEADYTAESWAPLAEALEAAESVLADDNATQEAVNDALEALTTAITELVEEEEPVIDKTDLQAKVDEANALNEADYTAESWAPLAKALEAAASVLADDDATQENVDDALATLTAAIAGLKAKEEPTIDKSALQAKINEVKDLDAADYTADSWGPFAEALKDAEAVLADEAAEQEDVDRALAALIAAHEGLKAVEDPTDPEEPADKSALQAKVNEAKGLNASDYTPQSWNRFAAARNAAEAILADEDATQADVDQALATLTEAMEGLEKRSSKPDDKDPGKDPGKDDDKGQKPGDKDGDGSKLPSTATSYFNWMLIGFALLVLAGVVWQFNRRRRA